MEGVNEGVHDVLHHGVSDGALILELLGLKREQVIPPAEGAPPGQTFLNFWSVVLHPLESLQPSKTGVYDEGLQLDSPDYLWPSANAFATYV